LTNKLKNKDINIDMDNPIYFKVEILNITEKDWILWENWLKKIKPIFLKDDLILSYDSNSRYKTILKDTQDFDILDFDIDKNVIFYNLTIYIKNIHTNRIKPNKYVYHYSDENLREMLKKYGITTQKHSDSLDWNNNMKLSYPNAIFAVNSENDEKIWKKGDKWQIDTSKTGAWWEDLNFKNRKDLIMTFENIPPEAIKLII